MEKDRRKEILREYGERKRKPNILAVHCAAAAFAFEIVETVTDESLLLIDVLLKGTRAVLAEYAGRGVRGWLARPASGSNVHTAGCDIC